ncbi:MAG TPA: hypothetical protein VFU31_13915 [Candidatus Binatia bacterium]|nr:hypothetical protein [Candidatus Binatia bacterium]
MMEAAGYRLQGWERLQRGSLLVGVIALTLCVLGAFSSRAQFFYSYLMAFSFWLGIALGSLGIFMLHNLTGGAWGVVIRRLLESGMRTLPLMAVFFLPLLFGLEHLYEWARPEAVANDPVLQHKSAYLNVPFFLLRSALYFALWIGAAYFLTQWSRDHDRTANPRLIERLRILSGPGLALYVLTITFASIDWVMSLEPHWFSTIYGVHFLGSHVLSAFALMIFLAGWLARGEALSTLFHASHFHDLGNLLLGFVMLWAYFAFSQYLIIWSGNLPEEITWYLRRTRGGWEWIALALIVFHFFLPFFLLLMRGIKRRVPALCALAAAIVVMRFLDVFWYTLPAFHPGALHIHWLDIAAPIGLGGVWLAVFIWQLRPVSLIPLNHPSTKEILEGGH